MRPQLGFHIFTVATYFKCTDWKFIFISGNALFFKSQSRRGYTDCIRLLRVSQYVYEAVRIGDSIFAADFFHTALYRQFAKTSARTPKLRHRNGHGSKRLDKIGAPPTRSETASSYSNRKCSDTLS